MPAPTAANPNPSFGPPVADPDRGRQHDGEHERPLHPGHLGRPEHVGRGRAPRAVLSTSLQLPGRGVHLRRPGEPGATSATCASGYVSSTNGGATWSAPTYLAHMAMPSLVRSSQGLMVGDYSTADVIPNGPHKGNSISAFAVGLDDKTLNQPMYVQVARACRSPAAPAPRRSRPPAAVAQAKTFVAPAGPGAPQGAVAGIGRSSPRARRASRRRALLLLSRARATSSADGARRGTRSSHA